jgi:hypothetical protein
MRSGRGSSHGGVEERSSALRAGAAHSERGAKVLLVLLRTMRAFQVLEKPTYVLGRHVHGLRRASRNVLAACHVPAGIALEERQLRERLTLRSARGVLYRRPWSIFSIT